MTHNDLIHQITKTIHTSELLTEGTALQEEFMSLQDIILSDCKIAKWIEKLDDKASSFNKVTLPYLDVTPLADIRTTLQKSVRDLYARAVEEHDKVTPTPTEPSSQTTKKTSNVTKFTLDLRNSQDYPKIGTISLSSSTLP